MKLARSIWRNAQTMGKSFSNAFGKAARNKSSISKGIANRINSSTVFKNMSKGVSNSAAHITDATGILYGRSNLARMQRRSIISRPGSLTTQLTVGTVGMASLALMNGGMQQSHDIMMQRYMRDQKYAGKLMNMGVGRATGNSSLNIGNHAGLSLSLSRIRHGH